MRTPLAAGLVALCACGSSESLSGNPPPPSRQAPAARSGHAMVFDDARGVTVLFGGTTASDTWTWNGTTWTRAATTGPSPRNIPTLAYDARRQRVVLFGGQSGLTLFNDTWEWDGATWTQRATTGPEPRIHQVGAYDHRRERVVIFGGAAANDATLSDTWEWDGATWVRMASVGPDRFTNGMVFDRARNELLLHVLERTPQANSTYRSELYVWSGAAWTLTGAPASGPAFSPTQGIVSLGSGAASSCSTAERGREAPQRGVGRQPDGRRCRAPHPGNGAGTPWRTTVRATASCCSGAFPAGLTSPTRGNGAASRGPR